MLPSFLWDLTLEEESETVIQQSEKFRKGNSMMPGTKKFKLKWIDFSHFLVKHRK